MLIEKLKIRCKDGYPCHGCRNSRIKCTYLRAQQPRGPQRLRSTTQYLIDQVQRGAAAQSSQNTSHFRELQGADVPTQFPAGGRSSDRQSERCVFKCQTLTCSFLILAIIEQFIIYMPNPNGCHCLPPLYLSCAHVSRVANC